MSGEAWFRPKRYGYGATPANWKGWALLAVMVAILAAMNIALLPAHMAEWLIGLIVWLAVLFTIATAKGSGTWRWRWGGKE
ncbi:MAG TPA: hypothetical protein VKZ79_06935 [Alphaproteobacteria bacterium]|nr:hypothetical protein [Alphaproteobacteria bacterium]